MRGDGQCARAPDNAAEGIAHCIHPRVRHGDFVCCWCGDLFVGDETPPGPHGQYKPRRRAPREKGG